MKISKETPKTANEAPFIIRQELQQEIVAVKARLAAIHAEMSPLEATHEVQKANFDKVASQAAQLKQIQAALINATAQVKALREKRSKEVHPTDKGYKAFVNDVMHEINQLNSAIVPLLFNLQNGNLIAELDIDNADSLQKNAQEIAEHFAQIATNYIDPAYKQNGNWLERTFGSKHKENRDAIKEEAANKFSDFGKSLQIAIIAADNKTSQLSDNMNLLAKQVSAKSKEASAELHKLNGLGAQAAKEAMQFGEARKSVLAASKVLRFFLRVVTALRIKPFIKLVDRAINKRAIKFVESQRTTIADQAKKASTLYSKSAVAVDKADSKELAKDKAAKASQEAKVEKSASQKAAAGPTSTPTTPATPAVVVEEEQQASRVAIKA